MKVINSPFSRIFVTLLLSGIFWACEDLFVREKNFDRDIFGGEATLKGTVLFFNELTNSTDTASLAEVTLRKKGEPENSDKVFTVTAKNGKFQIEYLKTDHYDISISFSSVNKSNNIPIEYVYKNDALNLSDGINEHTFTLKLVNDENKDFQLASIQGKVTYISEATEIQKIANGTKIILTPTNRNSEDVIPKKYEFSTNEKGEFTQQFLPGGTFTVTATFDESVFGLSLPYHLSTIKINGEDTVALMFVKHKSKDIDICLKLDQSSLQTGHIKLVTKAEDSKTIIPNVEVCLFTSKELLNADDEGCAGNIRSGTTNESGIVIFGGLKTDESNQYYLKARVGAGNIKLEGKLDAGITLKPNSLNQKDIILSTIN